MNKRDYGQSCFLALTSDRLCERWTLLIFRELLIQPCRFKDLNIWLAGMGTNLLTRRLKELESESFIERQLERNKRSPYQLTPKGRTVEPIILAMIRWGFHHLAKESEGMHFHHWDLLAMKALFVAGRCSRNVTLQFKSQELTAWVAVDQHSFHFELGETEHADKELNSTIADFQTQLSQGQWLDDPIIYDFIKAFDI